MEQAEGKPVDARSDITPAQGPDVAIDEPLSVAADSAGNVYFASTTVPRYELPEADHRSDRAAG